MSLFVDMRNDPNADLTLELKKRVFNNNFVKCRRTRLTIYPQQSVLLQSALLRTSPFRKLTRVQADVGKPQTTKKKTPHT
jgi:hypothetical protein